LICAQLLFLESENPNKDISFYINSPGGVVPPPSAGGGERGDGQHDQQKDVLQAV
jgi:hypothetical protein